VKFYAPLIGGLRAQVKVVCVFDDGDFTRTPYIPGERVNYIDWDGRWHNPDDDNTYALCDRDMIVGELVDGRPFVASPDGLNLFMTRNHQPLIVELETP
jgi:hypothetical protein